MGRTVEITGPRLPSFREAVAEISRATGTKLGCTPVPAGAHGAALTGFGVPPGEAEFLVEVFEGLLDGRNAHLTGGVREVLGRAPRDFADFVRAAAAAGTWRV